MSGAMRVIKKSEAAQAFRAFRQTTGNFNTTPSRLLIERLAGKVAKTMPNSVSDQDKRIIATATFCDGLHNFDHVIVDNKTSVAFSNYSITRILSAMKASYSLRNFLDVMHKSNADKPKLAQEINDSLVHNFKNFEAQKKH